MNTIIILLILGFCVWCFLPDIKILLSRIDHHYTQHQESKMRVAELQAKNRKFELEIKKEHGAIELEIRKQREQIELEIEAKYACQHKWKIYKEGNVVSPHDPSGIPTGHYYDLQCEKCGIIKRYRC